MKYFKIARILKPQGIKGEVKLKVFSDDIAHFASTDHVYLKQGGEYVYKKAFGGRVYKDFAYLGIEGIETRNDAEAMRGQYLFIDRDSAAPLEEGKAYVSDLIGLPIVDEQGRELGVLKDILQNGAADVYCVKGDKPFMFPAVPHIVVEKDIEGGRIVVNGERLKEAAVYDQF